MVFVYLYWIISNLQHSKSRVGWSLFIFIYYICNVGLIQNISLNIFFKVWGRHGRERMVVGFTTTCAIKVVGSSLVDWEVYSIQHYVIKFVSDLRQVGGFLRVLLFPPPIKIDRHDITEILLKVALNTINQIKPEMFVMNIHILIFRLMDKKLVP